METFANASRIQYYNMISTIRQRLKALEDSTKKKMEEMKLNFDEVTNMRRAKETLLHISLQQLTQEKHKTTALEKNVTDAVSQNIQQAAQIEKLESIKKDLKATILEEQRLRQQAMENVSELQLQLQKMALKLHEVEAQLVDMESKWVITPFVQSYSGMPRARSFSADQVLIQKGMKSSVPSRISMDCGINPRSSKQRKSLVLKSLRRSTSPKVRCKITKTRRSTGQIRSAAIEPIIESPPVTSTPEVKVEDSVFAEASNESKIAKDSVSRLDVPQTSAVKAAVEEFEKLSPRVTTKGAVPKRRLFQASKRHTLKQESKTDPSKSETQHDVGNTWNPHSQSSDVPSSHPLPSVTHEAIDYERSKSAKRCLSPTVCVNRVKKLRAEDLKFKQKSLLSCSKKLPSISRTLQEENLSSTLVCATKREDVLTIRRLAAFRGGEKLLDAPVVEVFKFTPLHLAASWGHMESARALLDSGAGLEVKDWVNSTPLHIAAFWGHAKICRLLLGRGACIKARNCNEETPLHLAARQGHLQVVRLMVDDWWADLDAKDSQGRTPWDVAQFWNKSLVANWLARQRAFKKHFGRQHRSNSLPCNTRSEE